MPPAAEPLHGQVIAAVAAALGGIVASGTYYQSAERVTVDPHFYGAHMDLSLAQGKTSYVVSHDDDQDTFDSFTDIDVHLSIDVVAYTKFKPASEGPWNASVPKRGTIQARLAADLKNRLRSDEGLAAVAAVPGVGAVRVEIPFTDFGADHTLYPGWAVVMARVVVSFTHGQVNA